MKPQKMTWSVAATVAEPIEVLVAFAAHHIQLGALEVFLFMDAPRPGDAELLGRIPGVIPVECDDAFWEEAIAGPRPENLNRVQLHNIRTTYRGCRADWLFHIDADEFLYSARPISDVLAELPEDTQSVRARCFERVYLPWDRKHVFSNNFRVRGSHRRRHDRHIFGSRMAQFTVGGFSGHTQGKAAARTGAGVRPGLHSVRAGLNAPLVEHWSDEIKLCHFDGFTPLHWLSKLIRYDDIKLYEGPGADVGRNRPRAMQLAHVKANLDNAQELWAFHDLLKTIPRRERRNWEGAGYLTQIPIDPVAAVRPLFPELVHLYAAAEFDRVLCARTDGRRGALLRRLAYGADVLAAQ